MDEIVQPGQASTTEQVQTGETQKVETPKIETPPQPLTEDRIKQLIAEATQKAIEEGKGLGKREMQSIKDREVAEVSRKLRLTEMERDSLQSGLSEVDEETRTKVELSRYKMRDQFLQRQAQEETQKEALAKTYEDFSNNMFQYLSDIGVDPKDKRIEWGENSESLLVKQQRILSQAGKIQKEVAKAEKDSVKTRLDAEIAKARKELGLDSVDNSQSLGSGDYAGIPTKKEDLIKWLDKVPQKEYEEKWEKKVSEMRRKGLIT